MRDPRPRGYPRIWALDTLSFRDWLTFCREDHLSRSDTRQIFRSLLLPPPPFLRLCTARTAQKPYHFRVFRTEYRHPWNTLLD